MSNKKVSLENTKQEIFNIMVSCKTKKDFESQMHSKFGITSMQMHVEWGEDHKIAVIFTHPWPKEGRVVVEWPSKKMKG